MIDAQYIQKGTVYRIRNRKTNFCLTAGTQISMSEFQSNKISQLWLFEEAKPRLYHIINMQSGQLLSRKQSGLVLEKGNWLIDQFWKLERAEITANQNYFWIVSNEDDNQYLFASSTSTKVALRSFDMTLFVSNWEMQQVDLDKELPGCCLFRSEYSDLVIDVPEASNKDGIAIIQYRLNGHGNQRWVLEKVMDSFVIRNLCSNMVLCPQNKALKPNTKIVQSQFSNKADQKWVFEQEGEANRFLIKNQADSSLYLGVAMNKESAPIVLTNEKEKAAWLLEGSFSGLLGTK